MKRSIAVLFAASAFATVPLATASAAPAEPMAVNVFKNQASGQCLDDSIEYGVRMHPCNGLNFQQWQVLSTGTGSPDHEFKNLATGRCIGTEWGNDRVSGGQCRVSGQSMWRTKRWNDGTFQLNNLWASKCLEHRGSLHVAGCNSSREQSWL
ncbi:hypothetical protein N8J89_16425 [Crossiella sp. CA-258035]|uniref:RICIN domain-containing protein n=1 Tax=Crossiella sp. CA-258035 TaxID=2981138 RepID=UPI0024BC637D|nr:hypothetical protein [Crossiella sp. CA-258035]WHT22585.1 hypothetical protein N8J89_16425 [Crossiella sp. CA-258035]